jgi:hypothetical protein
MAIEALIIWLVVGAIAGWLAGMLVKGYPEQGCHQTGGPLRKHFHHIVLSAAFRGH